MLMNGRANPSPCWVMPLDLLGEKIRALQGASSEYKYIQHPSGLLTSKMSNFGYGTMVLSDFLDDSNMVSLECKDSI